jgi:hypothetical protein
MKMESPPTSIFMKLKWPFTIFFSPIIPDEFSKLPIGYHEKIIRIIIIKAMPNFYTM